MHMPQDELPTRLFGVQDPAGYAGCAFCTMGLEFMIRHEYLLQDETRTLVIFDIEANIKKVYHKMDSPAPP
jgi:hypothetical protein